MRLKDLPNFSFDGMFLRRVRVAKIYDGDTLTLAISLCWPGPSDSEKLYRVRTRLHGLDACEMRAETRDHGICARHSLVDALKIPRDPSERYAEDFFEANTCYVDVWFRHDDKYGRPLVEVAPCGEEAINAKLSQCDHFVRYDGNGPRPIHPCGSSLKE